MVKIHKNKYRNTNTFILEIEQQVIKKMQNLFYLIFLIQ